MKAENSRCLLLNGDYSPLTIIDWKKALIWSFKYENNINRGIEIIDFYKNDFIQCANDKRITIPAVAKTKKYFRLKDQYATFSRKNIFLRDNYTCQYCGIKYDHKILTYDHVIPKSLFKHSNTCPTSWTNIVTACVSCNRAKGNRTPKQANMTLKNLPVRPKQSDRNLSMMHHLAKIKHHIPDEWLLYLPESYLI